MYPTSSVASPLSALDTIRRSERLINQSVQKLATGKSIHSAKDNAAGLHIGEVMNAQYRGIHKAIQNLHDGLSIAQTADSALSAISDQLQRMREMALQSATGTLTSADRSNLDQEYQALLAEIESTVKNTRWNGYRVFRQLSSTSFELQAGPNAGDRFSFEIPQVYARGTSVGFQNGDFESNSIGSTTISGWTVGNSRVTLDGNSQIGGWPTPTDTTKPALSGGDAVSAANPGTYSATIVASDNPSGGAKSLRLESTGVNVTGYGIVHGPYIISNDAVQIDEGEQVSFDWKASGGSDAYDVYAYLLDVDTGATVKILDSTGSSGAMSTSWASASATVPADGNYKFIFVSGTFDATGGSAAGARLFVDNIVAPPVETPTLTTTNITGIDTANLAIAEIDLNLASVVAARSSLGAAMNRILHASDHLANYATDIAHSKSTIVDTRYHEASSDLARVEALKQGAQYVLGLAREQQMQSVVMIKGNDSLLNLR